MNEIEPTASFFDFNLLAGEYDKWYETAEGRQYDMLEKRTLGRLIGKVQTGVSLLEVGMGTGWWSLFFSELGYWVTGVDVSPNMVDVACLKNIPNACLEKADGHKLPFADRSFSVSAAVTSIEFTRDPEMVVREMVRCIKPGGRLFLGLLNGDSPINKKRKEKGRNVFASARFLTVQDIHTLLDSYGKSTIKLCAFPVSIKMPPSIAGMDDDFQACLKMASGAFIAVKVDL
ncbi:MAG: class I SAM-dependent methyltransferase [Syntrophaceae bacterium]|nr:class I SAM-dependent methyltransferase [Syntrophaceae bacterium]